jgi:hypothetical protein
MAVSVSEATAVSIYLRIMPTSQLQSLACLVLFDLQTTDSKSQGRISIAGAVA